MKILVTGFAVFGKEDGALYGVGETEKKAWEDAARTHTFYSPPDVGYTWESIQRTGEFEIIPCSERCMEYFEEGHTRDATLIRVPNTHGYEFVFVTTKELGVYMDGDAEVEFQV